MKRSKSDSNYASGINVYIKEGKLDIINVYSIQETADDSLAYCWNKW